MTNNLSHYVYQIPHDDFPEFFVVKEPDKVCGEAAIIDHLREHGGQDSVKHNFKEPEFIDFICYIYYEHDETYKKRKIFCIDDKHSLRVCLLNLIKWNTKGIKKIQSCLNNIPDIKEE